MTGEASDRIFDLVKAHYDVSSEPLFLSQLGILSRKEGLLTGARGSGGLKELLRALGDRVRVVPTAGKVGRDAVALPANAAQVERTLADGGRFDADRFDALPRSLQIAFCVRTDDGERVFVETGRSYRYKKVPTGEEPPAGMVLLDERFRLPGLRLQDASPAKKGLLWEQFRDWCEAAGLSSDRFTDDRRPSQSRDFNALRRLLDAQTPEVRAKLTIPGDIIELLLRHG
jgi:hypothetical protein